MPNTQEEQNKALVMRWYDAYNNRDFDEFDKILALDYVDHDPHRPAPGATGPEGMKKSLREVLVTFPDANFDVHQVLADGDYVVVRWTGSGTHHGQLWTGESATGKFAATMGTTITLVKDGKIVEDWAVWDALTMMQDLGLVP
jgi:steroid delta-isomerase-like uncharacterized protein